MRFTIDLTKVNKNNRYYDPMALKCAVDKINNKPWIFGQVGIPSLPDPDVNKISHRITDLEVNDGVITCELTFINNEMGKLAESMIDSLTLVPTSIGCTKLREDGVYLVDTFDIISFDLVPKEMASI